MQSQRTSERIKMAGGSKKSSGKKRKATEEEVQAISDGSSSRTPSASLPPSPPPQKKSKKDKDVQTTASSKKKKSDPPTASEKQKGIQMGSPKKVKKKVQKSDKGKEKVTGKEIQESEKDTRKELDTGKELQLYTGMKSSPGKKALSSKWFISHAAKGIWLDGFASTPIAYCSMISTHMLKGMNLECIKKLKQSSLWKMLNPSEVAYPRLTRLFYLNLKQEKTLALTISSKVAGIVIELDHSEFANVLGCPKRYNTDNHPSKVEALKLAKEEFFLPNVATTSKQLTHSVLTVEAKVLFTILMRCVVPKENSKELLTDRVLYLMYLVMHGYEIDLPSIVMEHMLYSCTKQRKHPLPYANLLTLFFQHLEIPFDREETITTGFGMIDENAFQRIGIVKTSEGAWKLYSELSAEELQAKKLPKPKSLPSSSTLPPQSQDQSVILQRLDFIENELDELKQGQYELGTEFKQMKYMIESVFKSINLVHVEEEVSQVPEGSKKAGSTADLFDEQSTEDEADKGKDTGKQVGEDLEPSNGDSIDSGMILKDAQKKKKGKVPTIVTSAELFEENVAEPGGEVAQEEEQQEDEENEEESDQGEAAEPKGDEDPKP